MSITLSVPPNIIQEVRDWAEMNGTSLNQYIRDCLEAKVEEVRAARKSVADRFLELTDRCMIDVPDGWRFNRESLYTELADR